MTKNTQQSIRASSILSICIITLFSLSLTMVPGCVIGTAIGGMLESAHRTENHTVEAEYTGIDGHTFAIVVSADRIIEANNPGITARLTQRINDRLIQNANPSWAIPSQDLLAALYNTPQWPALPKGEVADMLGVQRLVVFEITEFRLNEPGNKYVWDGSASGVVTVYETDAGFPDDPIYEQAVRVQFPDARGYMRSELPEAAVATELANRLTNRISWLFYEHEESNIIPY